MKTFLVLPYSHRDNKIKGVRYCEAENIIQRNGFNIGYFKECEETNPLEFHCKVINELYRVGNVQIEKCTYDIHGNKVIQKKEKYITCLDCKIEWKGVCFLCKEKSYNPFLKKIKPKEVGPVIYRRKLGDFYISPRAKKLTKEGHKPMCLCCGSLTLLTFDHIIPLSKGGENDNSNGQILCLKCNGLKKDDIITIEELKKRLEP